MSIEQSIHAISAFIEAWCKIKSKGEIVYGLNTNPEEEGVDLTIGDMEAVVAAIAECDKALEEAEKALREIDASVFSDNGNVGLSPLGVKKSAERALATIVKLKGGK